jgi:hypothetical protein
VSSGLELRQSASLISLAAAVDSDIWLTLDIAKEEHKFNPHSHGGARRSGGSGSPRRQAGDG